MALYPRPNGRSAAGFQFQIASRSAAPWWVGHLESEMNKRQSLIWLQGLLRRSA